MLENIAIHISIWNEWRKHNTNSKFHKLLVLLNIIHSPTFRIFFQIKDSAEKCNAIEWTCADIFDDDDKWNAVTITEVKDDDEG